MKENEIGDGTRKERGRNQREIFGMIYTTIPTNVELHNPIIYPESLDDERLGPRCA
jgi:hypothetical protein